MSGTSFVRGENPLRADKLNTAFSERVSRRGDTMQGMLTLWRDPSNPFDAATKQYVDRITVPPQGAAGPPGPVGPMGPPGSLNDGGTLTGPLYFTATRGTVARSAQDRWGDFLNAMDFGAICDGVTDDGPAINAALAAMHQGTTLYIPGPVYTSQTINVTLGRRLEMPPATLIRAPGTTWEANYAIIGAPGLSPVVLVQGNEGGLTNVTITRNGTPAAGSIGLQCMGQDQIYTAVRSYNHARGIQVGAPQSAPVNGLWYGITTRFDHCAIWRCTEDFLYLLNAPETTVYDMRLGINGEGDSGVATSLVTIDGDNNTGTGAGTTNTVTFTRCQFNSFNPLYSIRFYNYNSPDGVINFTDCYSGGADVAFIYIDPGCLAVRRINLTTCTISPLHVGETLISDASARLLSFIMIGCHVAVISEPAILMSLSGIQAQIIGNFFQGVATVILNAMKNGIFEGNTINTLQVTGAFAAPFIISSNSCANYTQTATGPVNYVEPMGPYGGQLTLGQTAQGGRVDFRRGSDGQAQSWIGYATAASATSVMLRNNAGNANITLDAHDTGGRLSFQVNGTEYAYVNNLQLVAAQGLMAVTSPAGASLLNITAVAGQTRSLAFQTAGSFRWAWQASSTAEGGSDAGSDLSLLAFHDNGSASFTPVTVTRSTGKVSIPNLTSAALNCQAFGLSAAGTTVGRQTVAGAWAGNTAGKALCVALAAFGLILDTTTA